LTLAIQPISGTPDYRAPHGTTPPIRRRLDTAPDVRLGSVPMPFSTGGRYLSETLPDRDPIRTTHPARGASFTGRGYMSRVDSIERVLVVAGGGPGVVVGGGSPGLVGPSVLAAQPPPAPAAGVSYERGAPVPAAVTHSGSSRMLEFSGDRVEEYRGESSGNPAPLSEERGPIRTSESSGDRVVDLREESNRGGASTPLSSRAATPSSRADATPLVLHEMDAAASGVREMDAETPGAGGEHAAPGGGGGEEQRCRSSHGSGCALRFTPFVLSLFSLLAPSLFSLSSLSLFSVFLFSLSLLPHSLSRSRSLHLALSLNSSGNRESCSGCATPPRVTLQKILSPS